jgi:hypothetical protein
LVWFHNASLYGREVGKLLNIGKCFSLKILFKLKPRIILEFEHALGIIGKLSMSGFNGGDLKISRPKVVHKILNFEYFLSLQTQLNYKKGFWKENLFG